MKERATRDVPSLRDVANFLLNFHLIFYLFSNNEHIFIFQLVPHFIATVLNVPGLPGLFLSCVAAGALR